MKAKRKILIAMLSIVFVLLAMVATIAIAFALTQQTITTTLNIGYTVQDIDGTASATYTIGGVTENLTAMKGEQVIGSTLVFKATDTEDAGNLMFPEGQIPLTAQNDNMVIQYTYSNTGDKHYIASMSFDAELKYENMKVEYSINGKDYSEDRYAVVVPANTINRSYWIKISIVNKGKNASFNGDFNWILNGTDELSEEEYLSLTSLEFAGSGGSYSASVSSAGGQQGQIIFPSEVNGDAVTTIAASSLSDSEKAQVTSVYIPDSVTTIGNNAFDNFTNLSTVNFEQNETAGIAAVQNLSGLTRINNNAFRTCSSLTSIEIPNSVTTIGQKAFEGCTGLTSIVIPDSVTSMGMFAFSGCTGLTSVKISNKVTSLSSAVFKGCANLTNVEIPNSVQSIGSSFWECTGLISVIIPDSVTSIATSAFSGCSSLTSIEIPKNVTSIGSLVFDDCAGLESISVASGNTTYHSKGNCLIETASKKLVAGCKNSIIPTDGSVTYICSYAFRGCTGLTSIEIPDSVTIIDSYAFRDCAGLTSIIIPDSVKSICDYAFAYCTSLTSLTIGDGVKSIRPYAFCKCTSLTNVTFENTTGWFITSSPSATSGTSVDVTSSNTNLIEWLTTTSGYYNAYWKRA